LQSCTRSECSSRIYSSRGCRLQAENLFLRHQLNVALRRAPSRLRLRGKDRGLLLVITRLWPSQAQFRASDCSKIEIIEKKKIVSFEFVARSFWKVAEFGTCRLFHLDSHNRMREARLVFSPSDWLQSRWDDSPNSVTSITFNHRTSSYDEIAKFVGASSEGIIASKAACRRM
jgi:hypothetical protein